MLFLLSGCGGGTTTTQSSTTSEPTTTESGEAWDLVYLSDSAGWGAADKYASRIEQDMGVEVRVHDLWVGGMNALGILESLRGEAELDTHRQGLVDPIPLVAEAEVIVVHANPEGSINPDRPGDDQCTGDRDACVDPSGWDVDPEHFDEYVADLVAIYDEIFAIRGGAPVILRTADSYLPASLLEAWDACDYEQVCKQISSNYGMQSIARPTSGMCP